MIWTSRDANYETAISHDGAGRETKRSQRTWEVEGENADWGEWKASYFIQSSVLGRIVTEADSTGKKKVTYVVSGAEVARQQYDEEEDEVVVWTKTDASGISTRTLNGPLTFGGYLSEELDALGNNIGTLPNLNPPPRQENTLSPNEPGLFNSMSEGECTLDGLFMPCSMVNRMTEALGIEARTWTPEGGFVYDRRSYSFNLNLPGRALSLAVYVLGSSFETNRDGGSGTDEDPFLVGSTGQHPGEWFTVNFGLGTNQNRSPNYGSADCSRKVLEFLGNYAKTELGTLASNAADYINPLLAYMQQFSAKVEEVTFAIANAYHETKLFREFVESERQAKLFNYKGGVAFRGRGYVHLTGLPTYQDIENHLMKNRRRWNLLNFSLVQNPELAGEISIALVIQTAYFELKGTFTALNSGSYLDARRTINPGESLTNRIGPRPRGKDNRPTIQQRITGLTTGLEVILKGC